MHNESSKTWVINSVGIDIGTTTTQVIFSRLEVVNRASISQVPSYEFSSRDIVYVSPAIITPIDFESVVHLDELKHFIETQYEAAGFQQQDISSGAIIITGETSKAKNARETIMQLSASLGDFVVATAGPHLESVIAGYGSGAQAYSQKNACRVLNIDIGGGTSNYVVFEAGKVIDTSCLNVGGRLLEFNDKGALKHLHRPAETVAQYLFSSIPPLAIGTPPVQEIANVMATLVWMEAEGKAHPLSSALLMTPALKPHRYDAVFISGGVGACFYDASSMNIPNQFNDYGPLLAEALRNTMPIHMPLKTPAQTLRATVIGAGAHTLSLSGSTIWLEAEYLPLKNIPVVRIACDWSTTLTSDQLLNAILVAAERMDLVLTKDLYALYLPEDFPVNYAAIELCVQTLQRLVTQYVNNAYPLIVVSQQDFGKVLGMLLKPFAAQRALAIIDEVTTHPGDYLDIARPFAGGDIVPITIKSLAFPG